MIICDKTKSLSSKKLKSTINELLLHLNSFDDGLIIISGERNADFVLKYWSSSLSKHSLVNLESNDYDKIPKKIKNIF